MSGFITSSTAAEEAHTGAPSLAPDKFPHKIFGLELTSTSITAFFIVVILLIVAAVIRIWFIPRWRDKKHPGPLQSLLEWIIGVFDKEGREAVGHLANFLAPWYIGACAMIFFGIVSESFGLRPPITDMNVTLALGLSTFIFMILFGIKERKGQFFMRYVKGFGIPIISDAAVPISMGLRLFISVFSGMVISELVYNAMGNFALVAPAVVTIATTLFHALIQSYVFMMLSFAFIGETTE